MSFQRAFLSEVFKSASSTVAKVAVANTISADDSAETSTELQPSGELKNSLAISEHTDTEPDTAQAMPAQQSGNDAERLIPLDTKSRSFLEIERANLFRITEPDQPTDLGVCISLLGKLHDKAMARGDTDTALELEQIFNELEKAQVADTAIYIVEQILESIAIRQERLKAA